MKINNLLFLIIHETDWLGESNAKPIIVSAGMFFLCLYLSPEKIIMSIDVWADG